MEVFLKMATPHGTLRFCEWFTCEWIIYYSNWSMQWKFQGMQCMKMCKTICLIFGCSYPLIVHCGCLFNSGTVMWPATRSVSKPSHLQVLEGCYWHLATFVTKPALAKSPCSLWLALQASPSITTTPSSRYNTTRSPCCRQYWTNGRKVFVNITGCCQSE